MNLPRVAKFWGEEGDVDKTEMYLRRGLEKRHSFPVIGAWESITKDGEQGKTRLSGVEEPFGYFEVYWVKEDILGRYCESEDWERGIHVLVGEDKFRGQRRVKAWLGGLVHYCFLDDARTMRVSLEPRADNQKYVLMDEGFYKEKEIAFPHKQAALMRLTRDSWQGPSV